MSEPNFELFCDQTCLNPQRYMIAREQAQLTLHHDKERLELEREAALQADVREIGIVAENKDRAINALYANPEVLELLTDEERLQFAIDVEMVASLEEYKAFHERFFGAIDAQRDYKLLEKVAEEIEQNPDMTYEEIQAKVAEADEKIAQRKADVAARQAEIKANQDQIAAEAQAEQEAYFLEKYGIPLPKPLSINQLEERIRIVANALGTTLSEEDIRASCNDCPGKQPEGKRTATDVVLGIDNRPLKCPNWALNFGRVTLEDAMESCDSIQAMGDEQ